MIFNQLGFSCICTSNTLGIVEDYMKGSVDTPGSIIASIAAVERCSMTGCDINLSTTHYIINLQFCAQMLYDNISCTLPNGFTRPGLLSARLNFPRTSRSTRIHANAEEAPLLHGVLVKAGGEGNGGLFFTKKSLHFTDPSCIHVQYAPRCTACERNCCCCHGFQDSAPAPVHCSVLVEDGLLMDEWGTPKL